MKGCHHCKHMLFEIDILYGDIDLIEDDYDEDFSVNIACERGHYASDLVMEDDIRTILSKGDNCKDFKQQK